MSQFRGLEQLSDILDIVKNPAKYEQKVAELQNAVKSYKEVVEAVVKLSEVNDYTISVRKREEDTKRLLADANEELQRAKVAAAETTAKAKVKASEQEAELAAKIDAAKEATKETKAKQKELDGLISKYDKLVAEQAQAIVASQAAEAEFITLKTKLLAIVN